MNCHFFWSCQSWKIFSSKHKSETLLSRKSINSRTFQEKFEVKCGLTLETIEMGDNFGIHRPNEVKQIKTSNSGTPSDEMGATTGQSNLSDFLMQLEDYTPTVNVTFSPHRLSYSLSPLFQIPDAVTSYYLNSAGFEANSDPRMYDPLYPFVRQTLNLKYLSVSGSSPWQPRNSSLTSRMTLLSIAKLAPATLTRVTPPQSNKKINQQRTGSLR